MSERIAGNIGLAQLVASKVVESAAVPTVTDILARLEQAPTPAKSTYPHVADYRPPRVVAGVNYLRREADNASLGRAGEEFIVNFERARLIRAGKSGLADNVEHASITQGDGLGYDVRSFETNGKDRLIEVKTTAYGKATPFFVTRNEVAASRHFESDYQLCRVFRFREDPRLFALPGPLDESCVLDPVQFSARVA